MAHKREPKECVQNKMNKLKSNKTQNKLNQDHMQMTLKKKVANMG